MANFKQARKMKRDARGVYYTTAAGRLVQVWKVMGGGEFWSRTVYTWSFRIDDGKIVGGATTKTMALDLALRRIGVIE